MCDYSLHAVTSRPAIVGDKLISTRFIGTNTRGFAAEEVPNVAVCLQSGTEIAFERDARVDYGFGWLFSILGFGIIGEKVARFCRVNIDRHDLHHDALEFSNGKVVLVTLLGEGQHATVLQLPVDSGRKMGTKVERAERQSLQTG